MLISVVLAFYLPFHLFLFSYIILGPLHYMTELTWLKERDFFVKNKPSWKLIFLLSLISIAVLISADISQFGSLYSSESENIARQIFVACLFGIFVLSLLVQYLDSIFMKLTLFMMMIGIALISSQNLWFLIIIALLLPTLIHTTIFTGSFILEGALKNKSLVGLISFAVFVACSIIFLIVPVDYGSRSLSGIAEHLYMTSEFFILNEVLLRMFFGDLNGDIELFSPIGLRIQSFIAFAYTYHYLNWFSKTEVIRWHKIPKNWLVLSIMIWVLSIALHLVNMKLGIVFISMLSLLHVCMEFPLNFKSAQNIFRLLWQRV